MYNRTGTDRFGKTKIGGQIKAHFRVWMLHPLVRTLVSKAVERFSNVRENCFINCLN